MKHLPLFAALGLGMAARAAIHFSTPLAPRVNGGYYPVQVRSLLEAGNLAVPDLPLVFWIQAAVAWVMRQAGGIEQEQAILLACKVVDCVGPALLIGPVWFLLSQWRSAGGVTGWAAAVLAAVHAPLLLMTSQYEKNALGLVWVAVFMVGVRGAMSQPGWRTGLVAVGFLALAGLTHIGIFGAALLFAGLAMAGGLMFLPGQRREVLGIALALGCTAGAVMLVLWIWHDPQRVERLAGVVLPSTERAAGTATLPAANAVAKAGGTSVLAPALFLAFGPMILTQFMGIAALLVVRRKREGTSPQERVFAGAAAVTMLILAWPFTLNELAIRLQMAAAGPLVLVTAFVLSHLRSRRWAGLISGLVLTGALASLPFSVRWKIEPAISEAGYAELKSLRTKIADPGKTLIVTRHGVEWWVVWALRTKFAHADAVHAGDWGKYEKVAVLKEKGGPQSGRRDDPARRMFDEMEIPADAEILAEGEHFTLARLRQPPAGIAPRPR